MPKVPTLYILACLLFICSFRSAAAKYYWIGGAGDWSDISHWSTSSGGTMTYPNTPTANDDVIFDGNSFSANGQVVSINGDLAFCKDFTMVAGVRDFVFKANTNTTLQINGNAIFLPNVVLQYLGDITINSPANTTSGIDFADLVLGENITFGGSGALNLLSDFTVKNKFNINSGTLNLGANLINCKYLNSNTSLAKTVNFQTSKITVSGPTIDLSYLGYDGNVYTVFINSSLWTSTADPTSTITLSDPTAKFYMQKSNPNPIIIGSLHFSNPTGKSEVLSLSFEPKLTLNGSLIANHNTNILTECKMRDLVLSPGFIYQLLAGKTSGIGEIKATGTCASSITLTSNQAGVQANIVTSVNSNISYLNVRDLNVTTGPNPRITDGVDLGNNTGLNIIPKIKQDLYWIGGTGNWNETVHWSLSSGGPPSGCLPGLVDNVFFDANSYSASNQTTSINVENAYCNNMTWQNVKTNSTLQGPVTNVIFINGSLTFDKNMKNSFLGSVNFISNQANNTIKSASQKFNGDVLFDNAKGTWSIEDSFYVDKILTHRAGHIIFNNVGANLNRLVSDFTNERKLSLNASFIELKERNFSSPSISYGSNNLEIIPGTSTIEFNDAKYGSVSLYNNLGTFKKLSLYNVGFAVPNGYISSTTNLLLLEAHKIYYKGDGSLDGELMIDSLVFTGGASYNFGHNGEKQVKKLIAKSNCNGLIQLSPYSTFAKIPSITFLEAQDIEGLYIQNIIAKGSFLPINAVNSIDGGGNTGWTFGTRTGRTLYWVQNSGIWHDKAHWSLTSGGSGGECIPTALDNVIFDENSFTLPNQSLQYINYQTAYCKNFTFNKTGFTGQLNLFTLKVYGDLEINQPVANFFINEIEMSGRNIDQKVFVNNATKLLALTVSSTGSVNQGSSINARSINVYDGRYNSNDFSIKTFTMEMGNFLMKPIIDLGKSVIDIDGKSEVFKQSLAIYERANVIGSQSTFNLNNANTGVESYSDECKFGTIVGTNILGNTNLFFWKKSSVSKLILRGNGLFNAVKQFYNGELTVDSLLFSAGKSYTMQHNDSILVNKLFQARGNNCSPISINSTLTGQLANILMPTTAKVDFDFVQMRDLRGIGGATFNAGPYSTNVANSNINWTFPVPTIDNNIGVLGQDRLICPNSTSLLLDANSFTPNETYKWQDGSNKALFNVTTAGTYSVTITFGNNCIIKDTVRIALADNISNILPNDTTICGIQPTSVNATILFPNATYLWEDNTTAPSRSIGTSGLYKVSVTVSSCSFLDSIKVDFINVQNVNLGPDKSACEGDKITLSVNVQNANIKWQNGSILPQYIVDRSGTYYVEIAQTNCKASDTVVINFAPTPIFSLGIDQTICDGLNLSLLPNIVGPTFTWQDGTSSTSYSANKAGQYIAKAQLGQCFYSDTIVINTKPTPSFNLGKDTTICSGESYTLNINVAADSYLWQDGSSSKSFTLNNFGKYFAKTTLNGCQYSDTIDIAYVQLDAPSLGQDKEICQGDSLSLSFPASDIKYKWQTNINNNTFVVKSEGNVIVQADLFGCIKKDTLFVKVLPAPTVDLLNSYFLCADSVVNLSPRGKFDTFKWKDFTTMDLVISDPGPYPYTAVLAKCTLDRQVVINQVDMPTINLGEILEYCNGDVVKLPTPTGFQGKTTWSTGATTKELAVKQSGTYTLLIEDKGCQSMDSITLTFVKCNDEILFFPNILKYNSAGNNNVFGPWSNENFNIEKYMITVFDRWGNSVYRNENVFTGWDGMYQGNKLKPGVYTYASSVVYTSKRKNGTKIYNGTLTIIE
jgi:gliding motility-associated-like protein